MILDPDRVAGIDLLSGRMPQSKFRTAIRTMKDGCLIMVSHNTAAGRFSSSARTRGSGGAMTDRSPCSFRGGLSFLDRSANKRRGQSRQARHLLSDGRRAPWGDRLLVRRRGFRRHSPAPLHGHGRIRGPGARDAPPRERRRGGIGGGLAGREHDAPWPPGVPGGLGRAGVRFRRAGRPGLWPCRSAL